MITALRLGTRGSKLALTQTEMVRAALRAAQPGLAVEAVEIKTSGDWNPAQGETRLPDTRGGKALFAHEIEQAILDGRVHAGVHSLKDLPSVLPPGLAVNHVLPRADPRDAFLSARHARLEDMPAGAVVGTASLRRQAFVLARRPDLCVTVLRGNVTTRLEKMKAGQIDAIILACAGLERLNLMDEARHVYGIDEFLPAAAQGVIGIEAKAADAAVHEPLNMVNHIETLLCVSAERAALAALSGSCHTPVGAYAVLAGNRLDLRVNVTTPDGRESFSDQLQGTVESINDSVTLGQVCGLRLKSRVPPGIL